MSNNVASRLYIKGTPVAISEFLVGMRDADNSFLMAHGPTVDENYPLEEGDSIDDWRKEHWGCKSYDEDVEVMKLSWDPIPEEEYEYNSSEQIRISFETPWSAPLTGLDYIAKKFKNLQFKIFYEDENLGYMGITHWKEGKIIEEWVYSIEDELIK